MLSRSAAEATHLLLCVAESRVLHTQAICSMISSGIEVRSATASADVTPLRERPVTVGTGSRGPTVCGSAPWVRGGHWPQVSGPDRATLWI